MLSDAIKGLIVKSAIYEILKNRGIVILVKFYICLWIVEKSFFAHSDWNLLTVNNFAIQYNI